MSAAKPTLRMVKASELDPLMRTGDVAEWFQVLPVTVLQWVKENRLTAMRITKKTILYRKSDVEEFAKSLTVSGTNEKRRRKFKR